MIYYGELAALTTAICWAFTSILFAKAGLLIGSYKVNKIRLVVAVLIYCIILTVTKGRIFPLYLSVEQILWLSLSGFVGLVLGDGAGFKAMVMLGPRISTLLYSSAPVMAVIIAWLFLGEALNIVDIIGIMVTLGGISWVVSERQYRNNIFTQKDHPDSGSLAKGVGLGLLAALGQASGLVIAKHAMLNLGGQIDAMDASFVRMLTSMIIIWSFAIIRGEFKATVSAIKNKKAMSLILGGAFFGPFLGVWMSLIAVRVIAAGVAATLNSTTPIWVIPLVRKIYKEKISLRAVLGAIITVGGITILLLT